MSTQHNDQPRVTVIGAGIAGLAAAYELQQRGIEVTVFEKADRPGGRIVTQEINNLLFDGGADFFSDNYTQMKSYARAFDIPWIPYERYCAQRIIRSGKPHILHLRGIHDILNQPLLSFGARTSLLRWLIQVKSNKTPLDFFDLSTVPDHLDNSTAEDYVNQHVHPEINDYFADPFTGAMQFHRTNELSAGAMIAILQMTMSSDRKFTPRYTTGGMAMITNALADRVPVIYGCDIDTIQSTTDGVSVRLRNQKLQTFDAVIMATPAYATLSLLSELTQAQHRVLDAAKYAATITIALKVPVNSADTSHCTYVPYKEHKLIGSYTFEENKASHFANTTHGVMNIYLREEAANKLMNTDDPTIFQEVITELPSVCPELQGQESEIQALALYRWPKAMPKFNHRYISLVREFVENHQGENNIYLAGDYLNSPWTEGAARSGIRAAKLVVDSLNRSGNSVGNAANNSSSLGAVLPLKNTSPVS